jgi:hypothetical protein
VTMYPTQRIRAFNDVAGSARKRNRKHARSRS